MDILLSHYKQLSSFYKVYVEKKKSQLEFNELASLVKEVSCNI